jgi:hypothetical protein
MEFGSEIRERMENEYFAKNGCMKTHAATHF